jgi:hypothetical protein
MEVPRTARKPVEVDVDAVLPSGVAAVLEGVEFALCTHDGPTAVTVWLGGAWDQGTRVAGTVLAGRESADKSGALVGVEGRPRAELWARPVNGSVVDAGFIDTIEFL